MIGFIRWQEAVGFFVVGVIIGWALSIATAWRIVQKQRERERQSKHD
jgi:uncharacterized membrane protein